MIKASDCKCIICGKPAVCFWPVIDPDIPKHPYCRKCVDKQKMMTLIGIFGEDEGRSLYESASRLSPTHPDQQR